VGNGRSRSNKEKKTMLELMAKEKYGDHQKINKQTPETVAAATTKAFAVK
jgi:hypothetical protein